ncbi:MAG: DDE-type integrase/transposase/recombinase [Planctomycetes bacterium]|nr:DDE-type integrase/transposase/recombinase [Planctomycetota bacterium]
MANYIDIKEAASRLNISERAVRKQCIAGKLPASKKVGIEWKIPVTADLRLGRVKFPEQLTKELDFDGYDPDKVKEGYQKLGMIKGFEGFSGIHVHNGGLRTEAIEMFAAKNGLSKSTLRRWIREYRRQGLLGLIDKRGGDRFDCEKINDDAFEFFKAMYLTEQQLSVKVCWQNLIYKNKSEQLDWVIPNYNGMCKYVERNVPIPALIYHREGIAAYEAKCAPYIQSDPDSIEPGAIWVGDHHQFNCMIYHRGNWVRPWLTAWEDMRSRTIIGWHVSVSPNQTTIMQAMRGGIEKYGPPDSVKIDNGRDYDSQMWTGETKAARKSRKALKAGYIDEGTVRGIYAMMNIGVSFSIPYHPQSKLVERFFDTLDCHFTKTLPTYCGKDSGRKPDSLNDLLKSSKAIAEAESLESFTQKVGGYLESYNNRKHSGRGMDGRTPAQVLASRSSRRVLLDGTLDLLLRVWSGERKVGKNGVRFMRLLFGQFDAPLLARFGKKVRVSYDPDDIRRISVYDATTFKLITIAEQNELIRYGYAVSEEALRKAMKQKATAARQNRNFVDSQRIGNMTLADLTAKAMQDAREDPPETPRQTIKPVATPIDNQVYAHERRVNIRKVKIAAGAESMHNVPVLDIDVNRLSTRNSKPKRVNDLGFDFFKGKL